MKKATERLIHEDRQRIEQRIAAVESDCGIEIVCACATESGRYDRAEAICGLSLAIISLCLANYIAFAVQLPPGDWANVQLHLGWQVLAVVLGFVAGNVLASYVHPLRRLFVGQKMMQQEVRRSAELVVTLSRISDVSRRPGILIYVSCFERRLLIRDNSQLEDIVGKEFIGRICNECTTLLKEGNFADAFLHGIDQLEEQLANRKPAVTADRDPATLPNHLLIFHPRPA